MPLPGCSVSSRIGRPRPQPRWQNPAGLADSRRWPGQLPLSQRPRRPWVLLLAWPSRFLIPSMEVGPGSLGWAACSVVGLTSPLCVDTEAPFTGATGPGPVENKYRPLSAHTVGLLSGPRKTPSLSPQMEAGMLGVSWEQGLGRCLFAWGPSWERAGACGGGSRYHSEDQELGVFIRIISAYI